MNTVKIDLNLFRVFEAIYSQRSLTRAGEALHISQPAVSSALARLRAVYDDPLFVRSAAGMVPTAAAEAVAMDVHRALQLLRASLHPRAAFVPAESRRRFRLGAGDLVEALLLPPLLQRLRRAAPGVSIEVHRVTRKEMPRELAAGQIDLAADALPLADAQLGSRRLGEDRYVCALRRGHPLAGHELTLEGYLAAGHIHASGRRRGIGLIDLALRRLGHQRQIVLRTEHYLQAAVTCRQTDLLLALPARLADACDLAVRPLPFEVPAFELYLYWRRGNESDPGLSWLSGELQRAALDARQCTGAARAHRRGNRDFAQRAPSA